MLQVTGTSRYSLGMRLGDRKTINHNQLINGPDPMGNWRNEDLFLPLQTGEIDDPCLIVSYK